MDAPKTIGRYEILEELGRGAMGTVYRAKDPAMDRVVAVKTIISMALASQQGSEFRDRFYREARAAGALAHPGIVTVFDVGEHEGMPFLVMEFVTGRTLADAAKKGERLSLDRVCEIGQKIAEALGYAHRRGVVHRDIKPANILLTSRETHGIERPKITDFGVAKLAEGQTTLTGQILGTPAFMPPEQITGASIDGRADIFSLGVVLYWMATGEQPFPGESMTAVSYKVVHTDPVPPRRLNPSLPANLENIILKCMAKSPAERYQTGEELARDLGEMRDGDKAPALQTAAPHAGAMGDPDATWVEPAPVRAASSIATSQQPQQAAGRETKKKNQFVLVLVVAVATIATVGGWYALRGRQKSVVSGIVLPPATMSAPPVPTPPEKDLTKEGDEGASTTTVTSPKKKLSAATPSSPESAAKKPSANPAAEVNTDSSTKVAEPAPNPAPLGFDPKTLDPKQNARLKIDAQGMPAALDFTIEMNEKVYLQKTGIVGNLSDQALFVPPGVQEFRVTAQSGAVKKVSNTVSTDFKTKKRNTLKIELRVQGMPQGSGMPQDLYPDSQLVLTLK